MSAVDDEEGCGTGGAAFFKGGYDDFLGGGELPAEIARESVTPDVGDASRSWVVGGDEPHFRLFFDGKGSEDFDENGAVMTRGAFRASALTLFQRGGRAEAREQGQSCAAGGGGAWADGLDFSRFRAHTFSKGGRAEAREQGTKLRGRGAGGGNGPKGADGPNGADGGGVGNWSGKIGRGWFF